MAWKWSFWLATFEGIPALFVVFVLQYTFVHAGHMARYKISYNVWKFAFVCNVELLWYGSPIKTSVAILKTVFVCISWSSDGAAFEMSFETTPGNCLSELFLEWCRRGATLEKPSEEVLCTHAHAGAMSYSSFDPWNMIVSELDRPMYRLYRRAELTYQTSTGKNNTDLFDRSKSQYTRLRAIQ